jgi:hypothetical protein
MKSIKNKGVHVDKSYTKISRTRSCNLKNYIIRLNPEGWVVGGRKEGFLSYFFKKCIFTILFLHQIINLTLILLRNFLKKKKLFKILMTYLIIIKIIHIITPNKIFIYV